MRKATSQTADLIATAYIFGALKHTEIIAPVKKDCVEYVKMTLAVSDAQAEKATHYALLVWLNRKKDLPF